MSFINEYVKTVIGVSLFSGIISVTAPSGANAKTFRFISGLFVLLCLILPLKNTVAEFGNFDWNISLPGGNYSFADTADYTYELIENEMKSQVNACVKQVIGESASDISVTVQGDTDNIEIAQVTIYIDKAYEYKSQALKEYVFSKFGITPTVIT